MNHSELVLDDIRRALISDPAFQFKQNSNMLRGGVCPNCGKKECYISLEKPFRVSCGRIDKCQWSESVWKLYPDIFEIKTEQYHNDPNPNACADAYMSLNRGFDLNKIKGMYEQGTRNISGTWHETVRVKLWDGHYWERLISKAAVHKNKDRKAMFSNGSQGQISGNAWAPPGMTPKKNDVVIMTEGIFKSMAFLHLGYKAISGMSAANLPFNYIKAHAGKNILWILALDNDSAGLDFSLKFKKIMKSSYKSERFLIAIPPKKDDDWDDLFRKGNLDENMLKDSIWRGNVALASTVNEKAAWIFTNNPYHHFHVEHDNKLYSFEIETSGGDGGVSFIKNPNELYMSIDVNVFASYIKNRTRISNTCADFLYYERDAVTGALTYFFKIPIDTNGNWQKLSIAGSLAATPEIWNKTLMDSSEGRNFRGSKKDLNLLHDLWFGERPISYVRSLPFVGYDKVTKCYAFYDWAVYDGQIMPPNAYDFFTVGNNNVKCRSSKREENRSDQMHRPEGDFKGDWLESYRIAFDINGMVALAWWLGTLFSEQIRAEYGYWPILEVSGEQGSGKTQLIEFLWRCCGRPEYEGFDPSKSTAVGRARTFQQVSNLPVVLLEGDRENGRSGWDYNELKMLYNGRFGRAIGMKTQGNETIDSVFRGGVMVAQNATIHTDSDAVLARLIHVHCTKEHFTEDGEKHALSLNRMTVKELVPFIGAALQNEKRLLATFKKEFEAIDNEWLNDNRQVQNRIIHNHAMIFAWAKTAAVLFGKHFKQSYLDELKHYILARALDRQQRCTEEHPQVALFWEHFEYLQGLYAEYGAPKNMLNHSKTPHVVAINLVHYQQRASSHRLDVIPINDLKQILPTSRKYKFIAKSVAVNSAIESGSTPRCWTFEMPNKTGGL